MKKFNILKIIKIVLAVLTAGKAIHDEVKSTKKDIDPSTGLDRIDNTDPQNPNYPPKK
jgi:hypothetical protein